ncbi:MAG: hypothetical protein K6A40_12370 [Solobacterium sp.]|nr:hypothetical protein [Solobacterium sp.]
MDQKTEELYKEYDRKMNEMCNDSPIYDTDDLFNTYRTYRKVILAKREGKSEDALEKDIRAFAAMTDALHVREDAPERIYLWPEGKMPAEPESRIPPMFRMAEDFRPFMYEVLVSPDVTPKGAVLCVAGGFQGRTVVNEGYGAALEFRKLGYQCFVIHNRVNAIDFNTKCSLNGKENGADIARAIRYIRANAEKYRITADRVAAAGFSNGGATIENCVQYYSGTRTVKEYFPGYEPDELDAYYGAPDAYINVYGQRFPEVPFDWTGVVYPPVFEAAGRDDDTGAANNLYTLLPDLLAHDVPVEVHTFAGTPHGRAAYNLIWEKEDHPNFDLFVPLADAFMQDVYQKNERRD